MGKPARQKIAMRTIQRRWKIRKIILEIRNLVYTFRNKECNKYSNTIERLIFETTIRIYPLRAKKIQNEAEAIFSL